MQGINFLFCESPGPEPMGRICMVLFAPNVQTLASRCPGVKADRQPEINNLEHMTYVSHYGWISFGFGLSVLW